MPPPQRLVLDQNAQREQAEQGAAQLRVQPPLTPSRVSAAAVSKVVPTAAGTVTIPLENTMEAAIKWLLSEQELLAASAAA